MYNVALVSTLPEDWNRAMRTVVDGIRVGVKSACLEGADEARKVHKYKDRTGALTQSIDGGKVENIPLGAEGEIVAKAKYASYVEDGTRPHEIRPRFAKALRWEDEGGVHFASVVHHPGTRPFPFMGPAYQKAERVLQRDIEAHVATAQSALEK